MATLDAPSTKPADLKHHEFSSRPVSTSSSTSATSVVESTGATVTAAITTNNKLPESQDSFSAMPTPRNTFLTPPAGISISDKASGTSSATAVQNQQKAPNWDSEKHHQQLQALLEQKGALREDSVDRRPSASASAAQQQQQQQEPQEQEQEQSVATPMPLSFATYDDSYCLLNLPSASDDGPRSRDAAIAMLRSLAQSGDRASAAEDSAIAGMPLSLTAPVEAITQMEDALAAIVSRRQLPNHTHTHYSTKGGAGSPAATTGATGPGKAARRSQQRSSAMPTDAASSDDRRSMRSRASVMPGEIAAALAAGATPYMDLNGHIDRLTACISRLQLASPDTGTLKAASLKASSMVTLQPRASHTRQGSITAGYLGSNPAVSTQSLVGTPLTAENLPPPSLPSHYDLNQRRPSLARLSPVSESPVIDRSVERKKPTRSRSSSHLSGMSSESRRRIMVAGVLTSAQYPNLFGSSIPDIAASAKTQQQPHQSLSNSAKQSIHNESIYSHDSSENRGHLSPALNLRDILPANDSQRPPSIMSKAMSRGSSSASFNAPSVYVRDITPASRLALWLHMHTTVESSKSSLWRRKQWQRRFVIFAGNVLYLFKSSSPSATALSTIRLRPNTIACVNDSFHNRNWVVEITQPQHIQEQPQQLHTAPVVLPSVPQSWYFHTETRNEMIILLKQLKAVVAELQVQPDIERKEEERMRNRRKTQRKEARNKSDVCPWEVDEFSDGGSVATDGEVGDTGNSHMLPGNKGPYRIPDDELFSSDDDNDCRPLADLHTEAAGNAPNLEKYSLAGGARGTRPARLQIDNYTGTGGIAEWGAHRLQMPYSPAPSSAGMDPVKMRSYSADPSAATGRRPSLADVLAPPSSAMQELTPIPHYSPDVSPQTQPQVVRNRSLRTNTELAMRNSTMIRSDATALIDQMFASASREFLTPEDDNIRGTDGSESHSGRAGLSSKSNLIAVREDDC
ncbi:hypothetical protein H4R24_001759 [Coemansia sp. RSA 988]|nr:hypothetical protein H4R24_001759 [Coemansia sp. RSA 988]